MCINTKKIIENVLKTVRYIWKRVCKFRRKIWLFESYNIYIANLSGEINLLKKDVFFKQGTIEDIPFVAEQFSSHFGLDAEKVLLNRLRGNEILIVGYMGENSKEICYLSWLSENDPFFKAANRIKNIKNGICTYRTLVPIQFRKMGIAIAGKTFAMRLAFQLGYQKLFSFVEKRNIASNRMNYSLGLKPQGQLMRLILLKRQFLKIRW